MYVYTYILYIDIHIQTEVSDTTAMFGMWGHNMLVILGVAPAVQEHAKPAIMQETSTPFRRGASIVKEWTKPVVSCKAIIEF